MSNSQPCSRQRSPPSSSRRPVLTSTYRGIGAESDLIAAGLLPVGNLQPLKARLRLMVGLGLGLAPGKIFPVD